MHPEPRSARGTVPFRRAVDTLPAHRIEHSWQRCRSHGLSETQLPAFDPLSARRLEETREINRMLAAHALPVMESLYDQIIDTESMIVLTDAGGLILHSLGDDAFLQRAEKVALKPGVLWSETSKGTNAIGTAIVERAPTVVRGSEHFLTVNQFLTCSATPIVDPHGLLIGVLDVTGDQRGYQSHTLALVRMSASVIENHLFDGAFPEAVTLHFHARAELIGTLFEGIAVFAPDGTFLAANKSGLFQLGEPMARLRGKPFAQLFGVPLPAVLGSAQQRVQRLTSLSLPTGVRVMARVDAGQRLSPRRMWVPLHDTVAPAEPKPTAASAASLAALRRSAPRLATLNTGDPQIAAAIERIRRVLGRDIPILIQGETGTGKELFARAIHNESPRAGGPFVAVNCASIPDGLIESELFGYEEGAFTGAAKRGHAGKMQLAHGGTLFLDEIGDMPLGLQARLLRVLHDRIVTPLGSGKTRPVDFALVCATHRRLKDAIAAGAFREDLYFRVNGLPITLPPLRARSDLPLLVRNLIDATGADGAGVTVEVDVLEAFRRHRWPGNLRQLASLLRTAIAMLGPDRVLRLEHLPEDFLETPTPETTEATVSLRQIGAAAITRALQDHGGNVSAAARALGISRNTIYRNCRR